MKKRIFIYFGIISILLAFLPFFSFEAFVSLSGRLYIDKPGYILIREKDDYTYYSNGNITEYLTEDEIPNYVFEYLQESYFGKRKQQLPHNISFHHFLFS